MNPGRLRHCNGYNSQCHCRKAGRRDEARSRSQDTGLIVLVGSDVCGADFSAKRRMRPVRRCFLAEFAECLHSPFCGMKAFCLATGDLNQPSPSALVSQSKPFRIRCGTILKDQSMKKFRLPAIAGLFVSCSRPPAPSRSPKFQPRSLREWLADFRQHQSVPVGCHQPEPRRHLGFHAAQQLFLSSAGRWTLTTNDSFCVLFESAIERRHRLQLRALNWPSNGLRFFRGDQREFFPRVRRFAGLVRV